MREEQRSPDSVARAAWPRLVALRRWERRARRAAFGAWALVALAGGGVAVLARGDSLGPWPVPAPLNTATAVIAWLSLGLALFGWVFWAIVQIHLHQWRYRFFWQIPGLNLLLPLVLCTGGAFIDLTIQHR